jgi:broad specificity polyphosphatase/5'/3'-nucleotidase SurE
LQAQDPEFKSQYWQKREKKKENETHNLGSMIKQVKKSKYNMIQVSKLENSLKHNEMQTKNTQKCVCWTGAKFIGNKTTCLGWLHTGI